MIKYIEHKGNKYLHLQSTGNAARWIMPLAQYFCKGAGLDIGCNRPEWALPGAILVDPVLNEYHAMNLPEGQFDYLFNSHVLEHIKENPYNVLDYWFSKLKEDGVLFMYLPHKSQTYWHPSSNRKHLFSFDGNEIKEYLESIGYSPYITPVDYNNSFAVICYKTKKGSERFNAKSLSVGLGIINPYMKKVKSEIKFDVNNPEWGSEFKGE